MVQQQSGWYPDPDGTPDRLRWWDGHDWSDLTAPGVTPRAPDPPPPPPRPDEGDSGEGGSGDAADEITGYGGVPRWGRGGGPRRPAGQAWRVTAGLVAVVLAGMLVLWLTQDPTPEASSDPDGPPGPTGTATVPPLAQRCEQHEDAPTPRPGPPQPPTTGPRVVDSDSGISYQRLGAPWRHWPGLFGETPLGVVYRTGYYFVTQTEVGGQPGRDYYATVISGSVPATTGDSLHPNIECVAMLVADDVRQEFYPPNNDRELLRAEPVEVSGHPAYLIKYRLSFDNPDYTAKGELVGVLVVDVGTPEVAVLYLSIPDTHRQYDPVVDQVIASARVP